MVSITLAVPAEMKKEMDGYPEINWSAVAREAITRKLVILKRFREFSKDSELTEEDAIRLGRAVNKSLAGHYRK
jgi:hypothetical protein